MEKSVNGARAEGEGRAWGPDVAPGPSVPELIAQQAERTPEAVALVGEGVELTYAELVASARRLAQRLRDAGAGPGTVTAACLVRSPELIVVLLAIFEAGGAYLPIDPSHPAERIAYLVADADCKVVVTTKEHHQHLEQLGRPLVIADEDSAIAETSLEAFEPAAIAPSDLAYVLYTSGSTGKPKGVLLDHGNLANYVSWAAETYCPEPPCSFLHTSLAFDLGITSFWVPLSCGGRVVVIPDGEQLELSQFNDLAGPFLLKMTPAHVAQLAASKEISDAVVVAVLGGEQLLAEHVHRLLAVLPNAVILNEYGPTETTVGSTIYLVDASLIEAGPVSIGLPIANTSCYVLDADLHPLPADEIGELFIGGLGVACGYLNREDLTEERFLLDPFDPKPGARMYRTGDRAFFRADGDMEFLGRADDQIKIRGYRIEPAEIELTLVRHPQVHEAVVLAREAASGSMRLVAYLVADEGVTAAELQAYARQSLPEYMVPPSFIMLERLPLTANGKVDKASLPDPSESVPAPAPGQLLTVTEQAMAGEWADLLGVVVSREDNFFDIGGDSILARQLVTRVNDRFGVKVPVRGLYETGTVASFAQLVDEHR